MVTRRKKLPIYFLRLQREIFHGKSDQCKILLITLALSTAMPQWEQWKLLLGLAKEPSYFKDFSVEEAMAECNPLQQPQFKPGTFIYTHTHTYIFIYDSIQHIMHHPPLLACQLSRAFFCWMITMLTQFGSTFETLAWLWGTFISATEFHLNQEYIKNFWTLSWTSFTLKFAIWGCLCSWMLLTVLSKFSWSYRNVPSWNWL